MKKILALILAALMLLSVVACAVPTDDPSETTGKQPPVTTGSGDPADTGSTHPDSGLPSRNYNDASYRILAISNSVNDEPARDAVYLEGKDKDRINDSVKARNTYVEELYGVVIEPVWEKRGEMAAAMAKSKSSGISICEVLESAISEFSTMIEKKYVRDISNVEYLDLTQDYWDQNCRTQMSIANALYFCTGDIMITDKQGTWAVSFNRDLVKQNHLENPYELVDKNEWTYSKMLEMAQAVSDAANDPKDYFGNTWGLVSEAANTYYMWQGSGTSLITKGEGDLPRLNDLTESAYDAMMNVAKVQYDKNVTLFASSITGVNDVYFDGTIKIFQSGHALFNVGSTTMIEWMRDFDVDFGVLPMPKNDPSLKGYYSSISNSQSSAFAIPYDTKDIEFVAIISQALACESTPTLLDAYYDKTLTYKGLRLEEDAQMLDLIFKNRMFDLTLVYSWADPLVQEIGNCKTEKRVQTLKAKYDSYASKIENSVNTFLEKMGLN